MSNLCVEGDEHMFTIAICDDERHFRKRIHDILIEYMNENDILYEIDEFESGKDFISLGINLAKYDNKKVLKVVEHVMRNEAVYGIDRFPPACMGIFHQPKRPIIQKKSER